MGRPAPDRREAEQPQQPQRTRGEAAVCAVPFVGGDEALVRGLQSGQPAAIAAFCDRFSDRVRRLLVRMLGWDDEIADLHHEVFAKALKSRHTVRDPERLEGWITTIAVNVARSAITRRVRRRWLRYVPPEELPERPEPVPTGEHAEALERTYAALAELPREERIAFSLRIIEGMKLTEVAEACGVSLATIKRRLRRAEARFVDLARQDPVLVEWLEGGRRWSAG